MKIRPVIQLGVCPCSLKNLAVGVPWSALLTPLGTLAMAEASYYSLSFLEPRALKKEVRVHLLHSAPHKVVRADVLPSPSPQTLRGLYTQAHNNLRSIAKSAHELDAVSEDASGSEHEVRSPPLVVPTSGGVFGS
jgi:hypothetical protein